MLKNKPSLVLLLTLLIHTTTYNKRMSQPTQLQQIQQSRSLGIQQQASSIVKTSVDTSSGKQRLSDYNFGAASVLPFMKRHKNYFFILSREAYGKAKGTYDDFGGSRDPGENHPVITAGREFFEEAVIQASIGLSLEDIYNFIDIAKTHNTEYIVAFSRNVAYLTNFTAYANALFNNFYAARNKMTDFHFKEKDRLALVEWSLLEKTIKNTKFNRGVVVEAQVLDPQDLQWKSEKITLRDFFVKKLRPFFMNKPYKPGMNKKIRFYDTTIKDESTKQQQIAPKQESWSTRFWNWLRS